ncbi:hypothetical protein BDW74DRAFT_154620 [Aspergillus multicolor]|uniref:uncharacterized protein n=1 Tax=Aspergillus multicolor TaxID=41759 RepID=UPI003CCDEFD2
MVAGRTETSSTCPATMPLLFLSLATPLISIFRGLSSHVHQRGCWTTRTSKRCMVRSLSACRGQHNGEEWAAVQEQPECQVAMPHRMTLLLR